MEIQQKNNKAKKRLITLGIFISIALFLFSGCFYILSKGINIEKINIANIELQGLYLKLNNKLILTLDTLVIKKHKQQMQMKLHDMIRWFQNSLVATSYFEEAEIKTILLPDSQKASIFYNGKRYNLIFPNVEALFQIQQDSQKIHLQIQKLIFNQEKLQINGKINYFTAKNKIDFSLIAHSYEQVINRQEKLIIEGDSDLKTLNIRAFSTPIESLMAYDEKIQKIPALHKWLIEKAKFKSIRIKNLFFSAPLDEDFVPRMLKSLYVELDLTDVELKLEPQLSPITTPELKAKFKGEVLSFELSDPQYENLSLKGSFVELYHLTRPKEGVKTIVSLKSKDAILDERIHQILRAYDVDFDIYQLDSTLDVDLKLSFQRINDVLNISAQGVFKSEQTHLDVFGTPVFSEKLNVVLDLNENSKHIFINDSKLQMQTPLIEGLANLDIDLSKKTFKGIINPTLIQIQSKEQADSPLEQFFLLNENNLSKLHIDGDFSATPLLNIADFELSLSLGETKTITLNNLSKIYSYSPLLQYLGLHQGEVVIHTPDFANYNIQAGITDLQYPLFDQKWNPIRELYATIKVTPNEVSLKSLDESILLNYSHNALKVTLANKNFDFEAITNIKIPVLSIEPLRQKQNPQHKDTTFTLYALSKHSSIRYKQFILPTDEIIINTKEGKTTLDATHKNGVVSLDFYDDLIKFNANNFSGNFINLIAGKQIVQGGLFGAKGIYKNKTLRADLEIQNTIFKNFATLQNIVALIDTIPSLIVFKKPGFSTEGYKVSRGRIVLELNQKYLGLKKIDLVGDTIDISGGGVVTLSTQELNISLTISTIKGLSEVLSKIPIVGYLLLGKEGKISTSLILKGTLQDPKSEVTLAEDIISAPFKIFQRIFIPD